MLKLEVSVHTVRRRLHAQRRHHRTPAQKQALNEEHRANRLLFAEEYVDKDLQFWGRVIFSDEKHLTPQHMAGNVAGGGIIRGKKPSTE
ncbi:hypothetical protein Pcinc_008977 [Petrolisthes cinctipes]|uniref:Transposase Tc1-like domain-containing protein n=1 Tax=Petrolisthes cinctipes TaxID=88211 RepID=A0AAE1G7T1_PETCI|nr:hypothetical protein Pcinc_008977 [Petrolisthes cinctipes]